MPITVTASTEVVTAGMEGTGVDTADTRIARMDSGEVITAARIRAFRSTAPASVFRWGITAVGAVTPLTVDTTEPVMATAVAVAGNSV